MEASGQVCIGAAGSCSPLGTREAHLAENGTFLPYPLPTDTSDFHCLSFIKKNSS